MPKVRCAVLNCPNSDDGWRRSRFYNFPKDEIVAKKWLAFCRRTDTIDTKVARICEAHFRPDAFARNLQYEWGFTTKNIRKLKPDGCPTVNFDDAAERRAAQRRIAEKRIAERRAAGRGNCKTQPQIHTKIVSDPLDTTNEDCHEIIVQIKSESSSSGEESANEFVDESPAIQMEVERLSFPTLNSNAVAEQGGLRIRPQINTKTVSDPLESTSDFFQEFELEIQTETNPSREQMSTPPATVRVDESAAMKKEMLSLRRENNALKKLVQRQQLNIKKLEFQQRTMHASLSSIFSAGQLRKLKGGNKRRVWSEADIDHAMSLYTTSSKAYQLLQGRGFPLPAIRTLQRVQQVKINGRNKYIIVSPRQRLEAPGI